MRFSKVHTFWQVAVLAGLLIGCNRQMVSPHNAGSPQASPPGMPKEASFASTPDYQPAPSPAPASPGSAESTTARRFLIHKVRWPRETLISMARWYTGSAGNWTRLVRANPSLDPKRIRIGSKIRIPRTLLKTDDPMPRSFLAKNKVRKSASGPPEPKNTPEKTMLFGPIEHVTNSNRTKNPVPPPLEPLD